MCVVLQQKVSKHRSVITQLSTLVGKIVSHVDNTGYVDTTYYVLQQGIQTKLTLHEAVHVQPKITSTCRV